MVRLAFVALAAAGAFWGLGLPMGKVALAETAAAHMVLLRFAVAALAAMPFAVATAEARRLFRSPPVVAAGIFYGLAFLLQFEGLSHVSVTLAALLVGLMPAMVAVCAFFMREPVTRASWIGVAAATLGAAVIAGRPGGAGSALGIGLSLASLVVFLAWVIALKRAPAARGAMAVPAVSVVVAALAILPVALVLHGPPKLDLSAAAWAGIAGQGVLSTLLATAAWQYGASRVSSASAGVFINMEPLVGAALGVLAFQDELSLALAAGGVLILAGSLVVVLGEKEPSHKVAEVPPAPG
jgi:drug/metabolite transporter (DMT)-like permease